MKFYVHVWIRRVLEQLCLHAATSPAVAPIEAGQKCLVLSSVYAGQLCPAVAWPTKDGCNTNGS